VVIRGWRAQSIASAPIACVASRKCEQGDNAKQGSTQNANHFVIVRHLWNAIKYRVPHAVAYVTLGGP